MSPNRKHIWIALILAPPALLFAFFMGLKGYVIATTKPLHPDATGVSSVAHVSPAPAWAGAADHARQAVRATVVERNLPGVSVAVGAGGEIVWAEGFGWADLEKRAPVTPTTRFRIGGVSMALTSAAVGLLLEKDRLKLDDEIQKHVPAFPQKQWPVTLRQLMAHVGGVTRDSGDEAPLSSRCQQTIDGLKLEGFAERPLRYEPGTEFRYSTYGWVLVSAAVEAAANEPFFTFMHTRIFEPLQLRDTEPDSSIEPIPDRASFYHPRYGADTRYGPDVVREGDYSCWAGASAFLSTPSDLVRFAIAVDGGKLLQPATVKTLQTPQPLPSGKDTGYGLGWDFETVSLAGQQTRMVGHDGEFTMGGSTSLMTFPDRGLVVAVTTNTSFGDTKAIALKVAEAFSGQGQTPPAR